jgi:hypothetical protein
MGEVPCYFQTRRGGGGERVRERKRERKKERKRERDKGNKYDYFQIPISQFLLLL